MKCNIPSWTGLFFSVVALAGAGLPFIEVYGSAYSLLQIYCDVGLPVLVRETLGLQVILMLAALCGWRDVLLLGGAPLAWNLACVVGAMASGVGAETLLPHLTAGAWCSLAGTAGVLLSVFFQRADRRIFAGLLAWWLACPVPENAGDCPLDRDKTACYSVFDLKRL